MSPPSPSLSGDSSSSQAIPACFGHALLYYPGNVWPSEDLKAIGEVATRPTIMGRGGGMVARVP